MREQPLDLVGKQEQGRDRRRVVGLVLARVLQRDRKREERRLPPPGGAVELGDPIDRRRTQDREPDPGLGAERLLRREVVGVRVRQVHG